MILARSLILAHLDHVSDTRNDSPKLYEVSEKCSISHCYLTIIAKKKILELKKYYKTHDFMGPHHNALSPRIVNGMAHKARTKARKCCKKTRHTKILMVILTHFLCVLFYKWQA